MGPCPDASALDLIGLDYAALLPDQVESNVTHADLGAQKGPPWSRESTEVARSPRRAGRSRSSCSARVRRTGVKSPRGLHALLRRGCSAKLGRNYLYQRMRDLTIARRQIRDRVQVFTRSRRGVRSQWDALVGLPAPVKVVSGSDSQYRAVDSGMPFMAHTDTATPIGTAS